MAETLPPIPDYTSTDPAKLAKRVAYDSYFNDAEQPVNYRTGIEQMAEHSVDNPAYRQAVVDTLDDSEAHMGAEDGQMLDDALLVGVLRQGDRLAASRADYDNVRHDLASGRTDPDRVDVIRDSLDQTMPELSEPYEEPQRLSPEERNGLRDEKFEDLLAKVAEMSEYQMDRTSPQWERSRDKAAFALREALRKDPTQVYRVEALHAAMVRNAAKAAKDLGMSEKAFLKARQARDEARGRYASGDPGKVKKPFFVAREFRQPPAGGTSEQLDAYKVHERKMTLRRMPRILPGMGILRGKASKYVAENVDNVRNPHIALAQAELNDSVAETGRFGYESQQLNANHDLFRLEGLEAIMDQIDQFNQSSDPDVLEGMYGALTTEEDVATFNQAINDRLMDWHLNSSDLNAEHAVFESFVETRDYLYALRSALDTMSPHNSRYERLHGMHQELSRIHQVTGFRIMLQRRNDATARGNFEGRLRVQYTPDMGLIQGNDDIVRYPDGSTHDLSAGPGADRLNADGTPWEGSNDEHIVTGRGRMAERLERQDMAAVLAGFDEVRNNWFIDPTEGNRNEAFSVSRLLHARAEADDKRRLHQFNTARQEAIDRGDPDAPKPEDYREDPEDRRRMNVALYGILYFATTPGETPDLTDPFIMETGHISIPEATFYNEKGQWAIGSDGSMTLYQSGKYIRHYKPDGTPV